MSWREAIKKPTPKPAAPKPKFETKDDDWDTDLTYENAATEKTQRYGSASVPGSGRVDHVDFTTIRDKVKSADETIKEKYQEKNPNRGYGGKYGTEQVMDKSAADFTYKADIKKHSSQTDNKKGFGGEYGVDERAKDKSAVGFDYKATVEKHSSQKDYTSGFGGEYGVDERAKDKSAVGFDYKATIEKHSSQKDYTSGFGGKYGVQKEEPSSSSVVQSSPTPTPEPKVIEKPTTVPTAKADVGNIRARFENMRKEQEAETAKRVAEERKKRANVENQLQKKVQPTNPKETTEEPPPGPKEATQEPSPDPQEAAQEPPADPKETTQEPSTDSKETTQEPTTEPEIQKEDVQETFNNDNTETVTPPMNDNDDDEWS